MGLGSTEDFSLAEARERARKFRQFIADGVDPIDFNRDQKSKQSKLKAEAERNKRTFKFCTDDYYSDHRDSWKNAKHASQWINTLTTYAFPVLAERYVSDIQRDDIRAVLVDIWKEKPETAHRVFQRMRMVINHAAAKQYCTGLNTEEWKQIKAALGSNGRRMRKHHDSCPHGRVGEIVRSVRSGTSSEIVQLAFEFIVLTAARSGEVRHASWSEVSEDSNLWDIPAERMKAGRRHRVPLSSAARSILVRAKQLSPNSELIFPNTKGTALSDMVFTQLLRRLGVSYTMHGFRASFRTWGAEITDHKRELLEIALSHQVGSEVEQAYNHSDMIEKRRQLMEHWALYIAD